jgi:two-component system chemotaxis response regulator CheB
MNSRFFRRGCPETHAFTPGHRHWLVQIEVPCRLVANPDIIVVGASAGGVEALSALVAGLPPTLPAAMLVVMHIPPYLKSDLPRILSRHSKLPAVHPESGQHIEHGRIYVAPPDHHLLVDDARIQLWRGPKENHHRPAINALFRSAAVSFGNRVIGVILTGVLDDGTTGLWWVKRFGGIAIVQHPEDAIFGAMPRNALQHVLVDHVVRLLEIGALLVKLTTGALRPEVQVDEEASWKRRNS